LRDNLQGKINSGVALEASKFRQIVTENTLRSCQLFVGLPAADRFVRHPEAPRQGRISFSRRGSQRRFLCSPEGRDKHSSRQCCGQRADDPYVSTCRILRRSDTRNRRRLSGGRARDRADDYSVRSENDFVELLRRRPDLALRMLGSMSQHLRVIVGLLDDLTLKDMETRLANWLLKRCPRSISDRAIEIELDRTKRVLAAEMGTTSATLSRTLAKFRDQNLLRVKGNTITLTKPRDLQELLQRLQS
jgi:Crp-like helix-turn-helix domain